VYVLITALQSESITKEERALGTFTRRKLKTLPTWSLWHLAEKKQLDQFESLVMYGKRPALMQRKFRDVIDGEKI
jgi:hypothetical protein